MHAPHQEGRARPSLFFVLDLRLSSMDPVGVHTLGSPAAQGGQDTTYLPRKHVRGAYDPVVLEEQQGGKRVN